MSDNSCCMSAAQALDWVTKSLTYLAGKRASKQLNSPFQVSNFLRTGNSQTAQCLTSLLTTAGDTDTVLSGDGQVDVESLARNNLFAIWKEYGEGSYLDLSESDTRQDDLSALSNFVVPIIIDHISKQAHWDVYQSDEVADRFSTFGDLNGTGSYPLQAYPTKAEWRRNKSNWGKLSPSLQRAANDRDATRSKCMLLGDRLACYVNSLLPGILAEERTNAALLFPTRAGIPSKDAGYTLQDDVARSLSDLEDTLKNQTSARSTSCSRAQPEMISSANINDLISKFRQAREAGDLTNMVVQSINPKLPLIPQDDPWSIWASHTISKHLIKICTDNHKPKEPVPSSSGHLAQELTTVIQAFLYDDLPLLPRPAQNDLMPKRLATEENATSIGSAIMVLSGISTLNDGDQAVTFGKKRLAELSFLSAVDHDTLSSELDKRSVAAA